MIGVGIIGLGTVGAGTYKILQDQSPLIKQKTGIDIQVLKVSDIDPERAKALDMPPGLFTENAGEVIGHDRVDIVVELIGGIKPALDYIMEALTRQKWVVTANKALLAERGDEVLQFAAKQRCEVGFEASVCGGIPVIKAIRDGLVANRIHYILGILNGTSNYILTRMTSDAVSFDDALKDAKALGFAEQDPTLDVEGIDAAHKLCILTRLAFSCPTRMEDITTRGISRIEPIDIEFARELGYRVKLLAMARDRGGLVEARVEPAMVPLTHPLSNVDGVYNAAYLVGDRVGPTLFYGKGAGGDPTGSAVVSDIADMAFRIGSRCEGTKLPTGLLDRKVHSGGASSAPYYVRFTAQDRPGVLSKISGILAHYNISLASVIQKGRKESGYVPIVMLSHEAEENSLRQAKSEIDKLPFIKGESISMRIEEVWREIEH
jgi:homoserine dehydrogenase